MAQLFSLGCYTFMKYTLLILLSGLFFCGCSKKHATSAVPAMDIVQSGTDTSWSGYVLHVTKRDGNLLEGVTITTKSPDGGMQTVSADTATFSPVADTKSDSSLTIILHNAKLKTDTASADLGEHQFALHK